MNTEQILSYETPVVDIVEVEVEQGFAVSGGTNDITNNDWPTT